MSSFGVRQVLVLVHPGKPGASELGRQLEAWLGERVEGVRVQEDLDTFREEAQRVAEGAEPAPDLLVVLGGDGALLRAVHAFCATPIPTLGVNFGQVGFLASTPATRWEETLSSVLEGRSHLEPRMRLELHGRTGRVDVALNDVVLARRPDQSMLRVALHVEDAWVTDYRADGLIVATPSGSTAYALSAGGPILVPELEAILVTPICSQSLANRPIVLEPHVELGLELLPGGGSAEVVVDGKRTGELEPGERLRCTRHVQPYPLVALPSLDPYRRLRDRLGWTGSVTGRQGASEL